MKISSKAEIKPEDSIKSTEIIDLILKNRAIENVAEFLNPPPPSTYSISYFGFEKEIKKTLTLLEQLLKEKSMIVVYTDYDADGITGGAILWETLNRLGFNVMPYVPHRKLEGYGFSKTGIDNVKKQFNPSLIISVDHGIAAPDQIEYATEQGIKVIVTDHHMKQERIPEKAEAIFHIPALSGSGVSYFFSRMIFEHFKDSPLVKKNNIDELSNHFENDYVALASIGTIADLVPLVGPSRSLVKQGLIACTRSKRVGLANIIKQARIEGKSITPYEVGFVIAPRINAIGRLEHAIDALRLLCTIDETKAYQLASKVGKLNVDRQDMVKKAVEEATAMVQKLKKIPNIIILQSDDWHEGIIGLIASKMTEQYYRPSVVMTKGDGFYKGSARSISAFHITEALTKTKEHLLNMGGHRQAAGFSVSTEKIPHFIKALTKTADVLTEKDLEKTIEVDLTLPLSKATYTLAELLENLAPYGMGNQHVSFLSESVLLEAKKFGKTNDHLKVFVQDPITRTYPLELIAFGKGEMASELSAGKVYQIVYQLEIDRWGGNERLRGKLIHVL